MPQIAPPPPVTRGTWRDHEQCPWDWREGDSTAQCIDHHVVFELPTEEEAWDL